MLQPQPQYIKVTIFDQCTKKARLFSITNNMKLSQLRQLIQKQWQIKQFKFINDNTPCSKATQKHTPVTMYMKPYYLITIMTQVRDQPKKQSKIIQKQSKRLIQPSSMAQRHIANTREFLQKQRVNQQKQRIMYQQQQRLFMLAGVNNNNNNNNNSSSNNNNNINPNTNNINTESKDNIAIITNSKDTNNIIDNDNTIINPLIAAQNNINDNSNQSLLSQSQNIILRQQQQYSINTNNNNNTMNANTNNNNTNINNYNNSNLFKWTRENIQYCQLKYGIELTDNGQGLDYNHNHQLNIQQLTNINYPHVQWLDLQNCQITNTKWTTLIDKANIFPQLKILNIKNNQITTIKQHDLEQFKSLKLIQFGTQDGSTNPLTEQSKMYLKKFKQQNKNIRVKFRYS